MGKRKRLHRQAVTRGKEPPFRASPTKAESSKPLSLKELMNRRLLRGN